MKRSILYSILGLVVLCSCSKIDSGVRVYDNPDFPVCLSPVSVETSVKYDVVTLRCKVFQDAQKYQMEMYSYDMREDEIPDESRLEMSVDIPANAIPFEFKAPEEMDLFYRIRAVSEEKSPSKWVYGHFETGTDPSTICSKPLDANAKAVYDKVTFYWTTYPDTEIYELEVYSSSIPDAGEPDASALVKSFKLAPSQIPYSETFEADKNYYFRVRATAPSTTRRSSSWVKGSFKTAGFSWPNNPDALDYGLTEPWTSTINSEKFGGLTSGSDIPEGGMTVDKVTYGYTCKYYGDRIQIPVCYNWDSTTYPVKIPLRRFFSFKINRPGSLSFIPYTSGKPSFVIALITTKAGETTASYIYEKTSDTAFPTKKDESYRQTFEIKEEHLYGIEEAATVYLFSTSNGFNCYPITWTPTVTK